MTKEREEYLVKTFPKIYSDCGENNSYSLFGFECDDGWFRTILWLSKYIQNHIDQNNRWAEKYPDQTKPIEQVKALQVKEKFGSLRFYYSGGDEKISAVVDFVCAMTVIDANMATTAMSCFMIDFLGFYGFAGFPWFCCFACFP